MSKRTFQQVMLIVTALALPCRAGLIVVDHQPHNTGGLGSDTAFRIPPGQTVFGQRVADDFRLSAPTSLIGVNFWGFYNEDNPPVEETMRIRFYGSRVGDGLPDDNNIIYEESYNNPSRTWTGRQVFTGVLPLEYFFEVDLATPLPLAANTSYWLEIVQIEDVNAAFRWEFSLADQNGQAVINNAGSPDWHNTYPNIIADTAFQLVAIPEPSAITFIAVVMIVLSYRQCKICSVWQQFRD